MFFSCPSYLPFWSYDHSKKSERNLMHASVLKFHMIPNGKIADPYFFSCPSYPFLELCPFEKIGMKYCQKGISKSIWARALKLGQMTGDDEYMTWLTFERILLIFFGVMALWKFCHIKVGWTFEFLWEPTIDDFPKLIFYKTTNC